MRSPPLRRPSLPRGSFGALSPTIWGWPGLQAAHQRKGTSLLHYLEDVQRMGASHYVERALSLFFNACSFYQIVKR